MNTITNNKGQKLRWTSTTKRVDIDTGESLTKYQSQHGYIKINVEKIHKIDHTNATGHTENIECYQRNTQLTLEFNTNSE